MAGTKIGIILTTFITATLWAGAAAQSSCTNTLISMSPCLDYISGNSSRPSSSCCTQLSSVTKSQPQCLCQALTGSGASSLGLNINRTQALGLPSACKVQTPPVSQCKGAASPAGTSNSPATPSGRGSGNPTTDGNSSSENSIKLSFSLFCALLFIASTFVAM